MIEGSGVEDCDELFGPGDEHVVVDELGGGGGVAVLGGECFGAVPVVVVEIVADVVQEVAGPADGAGGEGFFAHGDDGGRPGVEQGDGGFERIVCRRG